MMQKTMPITSKLVKSTNMQSRNRYKVITTNSSVLDFYVVATTLNLGDNGELIFLDGQDVLMIIQKDFFKTVFLVDFHGNPYNNFATSWVQ